MNNYETLFILRPTLTDEEQTANIAKIKDTLLNENAQILATDEIGMRRLAYPIDKYERGVYIILYFQAVGSVIGEFERKLKFNEDVIKFFTIKYTNKRESEHFNKLVANANKSIEKVAQKEEVAEKTETPIEEEKIEA